MDIDEIPRFIGEKVSKGQYQIKLHGLQRINERGIMPVEVKQALLGCTVIENYPDDRRGHSCLIWGKSERGRDLHIVCGFSQDTVWVITVYEPNRDDWETPQKRRISK